MWNIGPLYFESAGSFQEACSPHVPYETRPPPMCHMEYVDTVNKLWGIDCCSHLRSAQGVTQSYMRI